MKNLNIGLTAALLLLTGCGQGTPGGPGGTSTTAGKPSYGQTEDKFHLSVPLMSTTLQQGGKLEAKVGIERAKNFGEDVSLKFFSLPEGVTVTPANAVIRHGDKEVAVQFSADTAATIGDYRIKVFGHPETGPDAEVEFKLSVSAIDTFALKMPFLSTTLKQNESTEFTVGISRDKTFDSDVQLQFGDLPDGVTLTSTESMIQRGEKEKQFTMSATEDAALGDFTVKVTGHPSTGKDAFGELKLSVAEKQK